MPVESIREVADAARAINVILAPAIMISAGALMILALQGKYSHLIDRLRSLNDERRRLRQGGQTPSPQRFTNVVEQIEMILVRARLVRNSIVSLYLAIAMFVLSSIIIGIRFTLNVPAQVSWALGVFMLGMLLVLAGTIYALRDIGRAYKIAMIEVRGVKELESRQ